MSTIANAKVAHNYNRYNGYFFGCLHRYQTIQKRPKRRFSAKKNLFSNL